jgi:acyl-CoA hydrolase
MTEPENDKRELTVTEIMTPNMANFGGNVHGGAILNIMDKVAYSCASRYSGYYTVTLSVDHVLFKQPIKVGELVSFYACVNHVGHSSMEVGIRVVAEHIETGVCRHTNTSYFTMVALDDDHKPVSVQPLQLITETQKRRHQSAVLRKQLRQEYFERHQQAKQTDSQA